MYQEAEADLTDAVDRRLAEGITQAGWTERKLLETQVVHRELAGKVDQLASGSWDEVERVINDAYRAAEAEVNLKFDTQLVAPRAKTRAVLALEKSLRSGLQGTHFAILRQHEDLYRQIVAEASRASAAGLATRDQVRRRMIGQFTAHGVTGFVDKRGRTWSLKSYTEMASRTAAAQAHLEGTVDRLITVGITHGKISTSPAGCDLCQPWEGKVVQISGPRQAWSGPTLDDARAAGLFHPRCTHTVGAFVGGLGKYGKYGKGGLAKPTTPKPTPSSVGTPEWQLGPADAIRYRPSEGSKLAGWWDRSQAVHNAMGARGYITRWRGSLNRNSRYSTHWQEAFRNISWDPRMSRTGMDEWNTIHELFHATSAQGGGYGRSINVGWEEGVADKLTEINLRNIAGDLGWAESRVKAAEQFALHGNYRQYREGWDVLYRHAKDAVRTLTEQQFYDDMLRTTILQRPIVLKNKYGIKSDVLDSVDKRYFRDVRGKNIVR
jgi:hypothetical protein